MGGVSGGCDSGPGLGLGCGGEVGGTDGGSTTGGSGFSIISGWSNDGCSIYPSMLPCLQTFVPANHFRFRLATVKTRTGNYSDLKNRTGEL